MEIMSITSRSVLVRNISSQATESDVRKLFETAGQIEHMIQASAGTPGMYYVIYYNVEVVSTVVANLNDHQLKTRKLNVEPVSDSMEPALTSLIMQALEKESPEGDVNATGGAHSTPSQPGSIVEKFTSELLNLPAEQLSLIMSALMEKVGLNATGASPSTVQGASGSSHDLHDSKDEYQHKGPVQIQNSDQTKKSVVVSSASAQTTTSSGATVTVGQSQHFTSTLSGVGSTGSVGSIAAPVVSQTSPQPMPSWGNAQNLSLPAVTLPGSAVTPVLPPAVRLSVFSGESAGKNDISYRQWRMEVQGLRQEGYSDSHIVGCVRRNVRGSAADLLLPMGDHATVTGVLRKFDMIFGDVQPTETVMQRFYRASQEANESVASWACRLEDILSRVSDFIGSRDEMLRNRFFNGLHDVNLMNALRHHYDTGASYEYILVAARRTEGEMKKPPAPVQKAKTQQVSSQDTDMNKKLDTLLQEMKTIKDRLKEVESRAPSRRNNSQHNQASQGYHNTYYNSNQQQQQPNHYSNNPHHSNQGQYGQGQSNSTPYAGPDQNRGGGYQSQSGFRGRGRGRQNWRGQSHDSYNNQRDTTSSEPQQSLN